LSTTSSTPTGLHRPRLRAAGGGVSAEAELSLFVAARGEPDPSFGSGGRRVLPLDDSQARALVRLPDGRLVAGGSRYVGAATGTDAFLVRLGPDGSLDAGFGSGGMVTSAVGPGTAQDRIEALLALPSGEIVAGGYTDPGSPRGFLLRYSASGSLQSSLLFPPAIPVSHLRALALLPDGKILAAGKTATDRLALARFNPDGTLDPTFGSGGVLLPLPGESVDAYALLRGPDGKLLVGVRGVDSAGFVRPAVFRLNPDGSLDAGFGSGGKALVSPNRPGAIYSLALGPDGSILAGGYVIVGPHLWSLLARLRPDGSLDGGFGDGGRVERQVGSIHSPIQSVALGPDGRVTAAGWSTEGLTLLRYNPDGSLDVGFGTAGVASLPNAEGYGLLLDPEGRPVVAGVAWVGFAQRFLVARFY
ncbi:delta-60 repeat domain-containing protein, partial [Thermus sp.]|uniref:delta-60 repeat domain-containing protein n=1 Tax=Thermus sp. TaxID=275 RepID=UPI0025D3F848